MKQEPYTYVASEVDGDKFRALIVSGNRVYRTKILFDSEEDAIQFGVDEINKIQGFVPSKSKLKLVH